MTRAEGIEMGGQQQGQQTQQHEEGEVSGAQLDLQEVTRAIAGDTTGAEAQPLPDLDLRPIRADDAPPTAADTPPGEDVRTVYSADRDPGGPMPATPQPS